MTRLDRLLDVEVRHFAALEAVAREGSFVRAGNRLGYTQSAISHQIAALERIAGQRLVERPRGPRPVSLTPAGELLLSHARDIVERLHAAESDLHALAEEAAGVLRIGIYETAGAHVLPRLLRTFSAAWPLIAIRLVEAADNLELLDLVEHGDLDLTFADLPLGKGSYEVAKLVRDPFVLLIPPESPLARRAETPTLREIAALPLIAYRQSSGRGVEAFMRSRGLDLNVVFRSDDSGTVQGLVAAGVGAAVVPRLTVNLEDELIVVRELGARIPPRVICLAWHRDRYRPAASRAFVDMARQTFARS